MPDSAEDARYMDRALELARQGLGATSPNPMVSAVLVKDGKVVGEGFHLYAGVKHAETLALEQAREHAQGATLYVNLEPCCHTGRTPPCAEALLNAGVARVVAGMADPNPLVAGGGIQALQEARVKVDVGVLEAACQTLNEHFARFVRSGRPFVTLKTAMTLDGKIAAGDGKGGWITGEMARAYVHRLRHAHDALLTGVGTVMADDPLLTDRSVRPRRRPLLRVVLDSALRLPPASKVVEGAENDLMVVCGAAADSGRQRALEARRVQVLRASNAQPGIEWVLQELARREIQSVLVEAGALINGAALQADVIDKVVVFFAPKLLGGGDAIPSFGGRGLGSLGSTRPVRVTALQQIGEDILVEGYLHDVYRDR